MDDLDFNSILLYGGEGGMLSMLGLWVVGGSSEVGEDLENLFNLALTTEERLACKHFCKDAAD
jgi:hypothetical protein